MELHFCLNCLMVNDIYKKKNDILDKKRILRMVKFPNDILRILFSELQLRRDITEFRCVCKRWNTIARCKWAAKQRWEKQRETCALKGFRSCSHIGEFLCQVCDQPEELCWSHSRIKCVRCQRLLGPRLD
jgi:hypothetical protein